MANLGMAIRLICMPLDCERKAKNIQTPPTQTHSRNLTFSEATVLKQTKEKSTKRNNCSLIIIEKKCSLNIGIYLRTQNDISCKNQPELPHTSYRNIIEYTVQ